MFSKMPRLNLLKWLNLLAMQFGLHKSNSNEKLQFSALDQMLQIAFKIALQIVLLAHPASNLIV
jgi:hypothetical protein